MLNKYERKLLKMAKKSLKEGDEQYICFALESAAESTSSQWNPNPEYPKYMRAAERLVNYIEKSIDKDSWCPVLDNWVGKKIGRQVTDSEEDQKRMRATRIAWINWMLEE